MECIQFTIYLSEYVHVHMYSHDVSDQHDVIFNPVYCDNLVQYSVIFLLNIAYFAICLNICFFVIKPFTLEYVTVQCCYCCVLLSCYYM